MLLQAHLAVLEGSAETSSLQEGTSTAAGLSKASCFVLACLEQLPHPLLTVLGQPLLLQPLAEVPSMQHACYLLLARMMPDAAAAFITFVRLTDS